MDPWSRPPQFLPRGQAGPSPPKAVLHSVLADRATGRDCVCGPHDVGLIKAQGPGIVGPARSWSRAY